MEFRVHPNLNNLKISSLGLNLLYFSNQSESNLLSILEKAENNGINSFLLDAENDVLLRFFDDWYKSRESKSKFIIFLVFGTGMLGNSIIKPNELSEKT